MNNPIYALFLVGTVVAAAHAAQPSGGPYALSRTALTAGGGTPSTGGNYKLGGSLGQVAPGIGTGGAYKLEGGLWIGGGPMFVDVPSTDPSPLTFSVRLAGANPFRTQAAFAIELPSAQRLRIALFSVDGRLVRGLIDAERGPGRHVVLWDGKDGTGRAVPSGVYLTRIQAGPFRATERVVRLD